MAAPDHPGHIDPLGLVGVLFASNPKTIKRARANQIAEAGGLAALWKTTRWPFVMLQLLDWTLRDRRAAIRIVLDAIDLTVDREPFADVTLTLGPLALDADLWSVATIFWALSTEHCAQLAKGIRAIAPPPPTIDALLDSILRADHEKRERRRRIGFAEVFERNVKVPPPFSIPPDVIEIATNGSATEVWTTMVGSASAAEQPILMQVERGAIDHEPIGFFMAGFWGHGVNSYSFYYATVTERRRIYMRIPFGGVYGDIVSERTAVLEAFEQLARIPETARFTLCGTYEGYIRRTRDDGTIVERKLRDLDWPVIHDVLRG